MRVVSLALVERTRTLRQSCVVSAALSAAALTLSARAEADGLDYHETVPEPVVPGWLSVPVEVGNAAIWSGHTRGLGYQYRLGILPGVVLWQRLQLHGVVQLVYRNPDLDVGLGVRPVIKLFSPLGGFVPIRALAEYSYLPITRGSYVGGGLMAGLGRLVYIAGLYGRELDRSTHFLGVRLGLELTALGDPIGAVISDVPATSGPPP